MPQSRPIDLNIPELNADLHSSVQESQTSHFGLAVAGGALGGAIGLLAVLSAGIANDNPAGWLAVLLAAAIGALLGA